VIHLLAVGDNLVELISLNQSLDHLIGRAARLKSFQSQLRVVGTDSVTELVTDRQLALVEPVLDKSDLTLSQNWLAKLK